MRITLTKAAALKIQAEHVAWYGRRYGVEHVRTLVEAHTHADDLEDGVEYDIVTINRAIPRGGAIEALLGLADMGGH